MPPHPIKTIVIIILRGKNIRKIINIVPISRKLYLGGYLFEWIDTLKILGKDWRTRFLNRFFLFLFQRRSARNLSRNACHTSLVESNGATVLTYRHFVMRGASFPSSIVSHLGRASTGKKEHRQSGARFVSTVSDSRRRSAP